MPYRLADVLPEPSKLLLRQTEDIELELGELLADRFLVQNTNDGIFAVDARHDRDAKVDRLARHPDLETPVLRDSLLGDVELRHHFHARDDRAVKLLGDRPHGRLKHAVDAVFHVDGVVAGLDVDVTGSTLYRGVDRRVHELDDRADVARQALDRQVVVAGFVLFQDLEFEALGRILEHTLRTLTLLEDRLNRRGGAHCDTDGCSQDDAKLVDHREVGRIGHDDHERSAFPPMRNEAIPQHQVRGNRSEQLLIDPELTHLHEFQAIADRQGARACDLFGEVVGVGQRIHFRSRHYEPTTDVNSNNGMYNASTTMAMMIPMNTSKTGSTKVMKRPTSVSISSS